MLFVLHLLSHGASWRTFDFLGYTFSCLRLLGGKLGAFCQFAQFLPRTGFDDERDSRMAGYPLLSVASSVGQRPHKPGGGDQRRSPGMDRNLHARFYRSELVRLLKRINEYLIRWARCKYKRLRRYPAKARRFLAAVSRTRARTVRPLAVRVAPRWLDDGSRMS